MRASAREAALWNLRLAQAQLSLALTRGALRGLTFELSGRQRQDARPGLAKMYSVPLDRAWWPAVGAPLERGVRHHRLKFLTPRTDTDVFRLGS